MKKTNIIFLALFILFSAFLVYATTTEILEDATVDQSSEVGKFKLNNNLTNLTDGNYTTYAVTQVNNTYAMINFTKPDGSGRSSNVQMTYNTSSGSTGTNYSLDDFPLCWANDVDKLLFRMGSNFTQNLSNNVFFENFTWINGTATTLNNPRINSIVVFNRTANLTILNESDSTNLLWTNGTNMTLDKGNLTGRIEIYNCTGSSYNEVTSGNWTLFPLDGKIFVTSNSTLPDNTPVCINYSFNAIGLGGKVIGSNNYTLDYLPGNITLNTSLHNNTLMAANYTYLTDDPQKNKRDCYNGSVWIPLGGEADQDELFDIRMFWSITGSTWIIDFLRVSPVGVTDSDYFPSESTSILFNITANLTRSAGNQTTVNVSLWTRLCPNRICNNTGIYTLNVSNQVLINASHVNATVTFSDGDRIEWYWAFVDNQSRTIENTTRRVIDIDTALEILSIGDETRPINFTTSGANAGDVTFKGDLTLNDIIASGNITVIGGGTVWGNATCLFLTSPAGTTTTEICDA